MREHVSKLLDGFLSKQLGVILYSAFLLMYLITECCALTFLFDRAIWLLQLNLKMVFKCLMIKSEQPI